MGRPRQRYNWEKVLDNGEEVYSQERGLELV